MAANYWKEEQEQYCKTISTGSTEQRNTAYAKMYPIFNRMCEIIMKRYFGGNPMLKDLDNVKDLKSKCNEKILIALTTNYDGKSKAYSYVQTIIRNVCYDTVARTTHSTRNNPVDFSDVDVLTKYDNVLLRDQEDQLDIDELKEDLIILLKKYLSKFNPEYLHHKSRIKILNSIIKILKYPFKSSLTKETLSYLAAKESDTTAVGVNGGLYNIDKSLSILITKLEERNEFKDGKINEVVFKYSGGKFLDEMTWDEINDAFNNYHEEHRLETIRRYGKVNYDNKREKKFIDQEEIKQRSKELL